MINDFVPQSNTAPNLRRVLLVRGGEEVYVLGTAITPAERLELHERQLFPLARRRFGARLRAARRAEDQPMRDAIKAFRGGTR